MIVLKDGKGFYLTESSFPIQPVQAVPSASIYYIIQVQQKCKMNIKYSEWKKVSPNDLRTIDLRW